MRLRVGVSLVTVSVLVVALVGCGGGSSSSSTTPPPNPTPSLKSMAVSGPPTAYSGQGGLQYKATGTYSDGSTKDLTSSATWSSNVPAVVTVNSSGSAIAVSAAQGGVAQGAGQTVTITATSGSIKGSAGLTVTNYLTSIGVTPPTPTISASTKETFTATGTFQDNSTANVGSDVTWSSSPTSVATITSVGVATGVAVGSTTVKASCPATSVQCGTLTATGQGLVGTTSLTVNAGGAGGLQSITVTAASSSILALTTPDQLTATGIYSSGPNQNVTNSVTWSVISTTGGGAGSVNYQGVLGSVWGTHSGTITLQAQLGTIAGPITLPVNAVLNALTVSPLGPGMVAGNTQQFAGTGIYNDGTTGDVTSAASWTSSAANIVTFTGTGKTGLASGVTQGAATVTATVTNATNNQVNATTAVNVVNSTNGSSFLADGGYAFTLLAANSTGPVFYAGSFTASGNGSSGLVTGGSIDVNAAGTNPVFFGSLTGSYVVYPDGRGLVTFNQSAIFNVPGGITFRFILSNGGKVGKLMEFDGLGTISGSLWQQQAPSTGAMNGNYVFRATGINSLNQPMGEVGIFNANGINQIVNGTEDIDDYGVVSSLVPLSSSSFTAPVQSGRGTFSLTSGTTTTKYAYYVVNASAGGFPNLINFIETDNTPNTALAGTIQLQDSAPTYTAASLTNGGAGYGFLFDRPVVVGSAGGNNRTEFGQVGEYTFDGVSAVSGVRDDTSVQPPLTNPITLGVPSGYNVSTSGINGRGTITTTAADSDRGYTFYMVSASEAFALQTYTGYQTLAGSLNAPTGTMLAQSGGFSQGTLIGAYALDASDVVSPGLTTELMWVDFDGTGKINGILDSSTGSSGSNTTTLGSVPITAQYSNFQAGPGRATANLTANGLNNFVMYLVSPQSAWVLNVNPAMDGSLNQQ